MKPLRRKDYPKGEFTLAFIGYGDESDHTVLELSYNNWGVDKYGLGAAFGHIALDVPDVYEACEKGRGFHTETLPLPSTVIC